MSHSSARICAEHKIVQQQCRCPQPITSVIEEPCNHGWDIFNRRHLIWDGSKVVVVDPLGNCEFDGHPREPHTKSVGCDDWQRIPDEPESVDDVRQSAMLLTDQEWEDLAFIAWMYKNMTAGFDDIVAANPETYAMLPRRRALCDRIIEAAS